MSAYPKHTKAVAVAIEELGVAEKPDGSNTGPRVRQYQKASWLGGSGWPWCVAFWLWCVDQADLEMPWKGAGAYSTLEWAKKNKQARHYLEAEPGDAVVFNIGAGHLAMLEHKVRVGDTVIRTIDGNVSNRVERRERPLSLVRGCVHVNETPRVVVPPKPPVFEVVTSASGSKVVYVSGARAIGRKLPELLRKWPVLTIRRRRKVAP